jgi:hypothetical protein
MRPETLSFGDSGSHHQARTSMGMLGFSLAVIGTLVAARRFYRMRPRSVRKFDRLVFAADLPMGAARVRHGVLARRSTRQWWLVGLSRPLRRSALSGETGPGVRKAAAQGAHAAPQRAPSDARGHAAARGVAARSIWSAARDALDRAAAATAASSTAAPCPDLFALRHRGAPHPLTTTTRPIVSQERA